MVDRTSLIWSDRNLCHFILRGMVDRTSLIWSDRNLCHFILRGMVDRTSLKWSDRNLQRFSSWHGCPYQPYMERQYMKSKIFASRSTCMAVSVSLSCLFVHEPPYLNYTSVLQSHFSPQFFVHGAPHQLHVSVGLTQARPNHTLMTNTVLGCIC